MNAKTQLFVTILVIIAGCGLLLHGLEDRLAEIGFVVMATGCVMWMWSRSYLDWWDAGQVHADGDTLHVHQGELQLYRLPGYFGISLIVLGLCMGYLSLLGFLE